ncbi:MAG TPA: hypothetical protein VLH77_05970 [Gammaproteobacteria bacterium]|nr:hypothetical protein [Gammaproteobacteria bacterium]
MPLFTRCATPLSQKDIFNYLKALRSHAFAPYSRHLAASLVEIKLQENIFYYTSGVNAEFEPNRLSLHSEQNALASALTFAGGNSKFSRIWIMAAPTDTFPEEKHSVSTSCGHCRQLMVSLANPEAEIYLVSLDGRFSKPDTFEAGFLPNPFSERDLNLPVFKPDPSFRARLKKSTTIFNTPTLQAWDILNNKNLSKEEIAKYFKVLTPHIINKEFQTSPITACILKCNNGRYAAGVLVQDISFLTTDAIFAALGNAITRFGAPNLSLDEIHLASNSLHPAQLSFTEIEILSKHFVNNLTPVHFYTDSQYASFTFRDCKRARSQLIDHRLEGNFFLEENFEAAPRAKL